MTPLWAAERDVPARLARTLIESQFPELAPVHIEPLGVGFDNTAYLVNEEYVFRFPRRALGADCMEAELSVLPHIATSLPLPVPYPLFIGQATDRYPWSFAGYRLLAGRTACAARLADDQRAQLARPLASFLADLHAFSAKQAFAWGAHSDRLGRLDLKKRIPMTRTYLDQVHQFGLIDDFRPLIALVDDTERRYLALSAEEAQHEASHHPPVLLHGDLYGRHVLVDDAGHLCGIIDWGSTHVGRIAVDLSIAHIFLPPAAHDAFRATYGSISDEAWGMARFRAVFHSSVVAAYAYDIGDEDLLREGLTALRYIASI